MKISDTVPSASNNSQSFQLFPNITINFWIFGALFSFSNESFTMLIQQNFSNILIGQVGPNRLSGGGDNDPAFKSLFRFTNGQHTGGKIQTETFLPIFQCILSFTLIFFISGVGPMPRPAKVMTAISILLTTSSSPFQA